MDQIDAFEAERPRLLRIATHVLRDPFEAQDVVQQSWLRLHGTTTIENLPGWLTTVTTRLCLDRLRATTPVPEEDVVPVEAAPDPADQVALADTVAIALQAVLDRLTPSERVAFVLHDSFGVDFPTIAEILTSTPVAARRLASRARSKVALSGDQGSSADWQVVDAFGRRTSLPLHPRQGNLARWARARTSRPAPASTESMPKTCCTLSPTRFASSTSMTASRCSWVPTLLGDSWRSESSRAIPLWSLSTPCQPARSS